MKNDEELNEFGLPNAVRYICDNVIGSKRAIRLVKTRNLVEGIIFGGAIAFGIWFIPFKIQAKIFFMLVFGITAFLIGCIGISNRSITEYIYTRIRFKNATKKYHKRNIKYVRKTASTTSKDGEQLTYAEAVFYHIKETYKQRKENGEKYKYTDIIEAFRSISQ